jgi:hypothetical protein
MKFRRTAALALVGWYLMVAPQESFKGHGCHEEPLGKWKHQATFDTKFECKRAIAKGCGTINQNGEPLGPVGPLCYAQCISSDDPHLKATK